MTASRPKTISQFSSNSSNSGGITKRPRGPINKRACQRCRLGKIKCDGDAENGRSCSNCDPDSCVYDTSPRKNKQVELLKQRLQNLEEQLLSICQGVNDQLSQKDLEKEILFLLIDTKELFNGSEVFESLKQLVKQEKIVKQLLPLINELLQRMTKEHDKVNEIIDSLQKVVICATEVHKNPESLSTIQSIPVVPMIHQHQQQQQQQQQPHHHHHHQQPSQSPTQSVYFNSTLVLPGHHSPNHHQQNPHNPHPNPIQSPNNHHSPNNNNTNNNNNFIPSSPSTTYSIDQFHSDHGSPEIPELANEAAQVQYFLQYPPSYSQEFQIEGQIRMDGSGIYYFDG